MIILWSLVLLYTMLYGLPTRRGKELIHECSHSIRNWRLGKLSNQPNGLINFNRLFSVFQFGREGLFTMQAHSTMIEKQEELFDSERFAWTIVVPHRIVGALNGRRGCLLICMPQQQQQQEQKQEQQQKQQQQCESLCPLAFQLKRTHTMAATSAGPSPSPAPFPFHSPLPLHVPLFCCLSHSCCLPLISPALLLSLSLLLCVSLFVCSFVRPPPRATPTQMFTFRLLSILSRSTPYEALGQLDSLASWLAHAVLLLLLLFLLLLSVRLTCSPPWPPPLRLSSSLISNYSM